MTNENSANLASAATTFTDYKKFVPTANATTIIPGVRVRLILALLLPWLQFLTIGRPFAALICLVLQITLIGWLPAAIWSTFALGQYKTDRKIQAAVAAHTAL